MPIEFSDDELTGYLAEALPQERMAAIEQTLRTDGGLRSRLAALVNLRNHGGLSLADVWRDARLTCPTRTHWGSFLLGALDDDLQAYFEFHLEVVGCRYCAANVDDLKRAAQAPAKTQERRQKFFQSSAGLMQRTER